MHLFIELWNATQAWRDLSQEERGAYAEKVGAGMAQLAEAGVEVIGWGFAEDREHPSGYDAFAVWRMPSGAEVDTFERTVTEAGWYEYFEQVNVAGDVRQPAEVMEQLVRAP